MIYLIQNPQVEWLFPNGSCLPRNKFALYLFINNAFSYIDFTFPINTRAAKDLHARPPLKQEASKWFLVRVITSTQRCSFMGLFRLNSWVSRQAQCLSAFFSFILLIHKRSHREVYQEFQPSYEIFRRRCQGLFRLQVQSTPSLHCPIANSASTQNQQPV